MAKEDTTMTRSEFAAHLGFPDIGAMDRATHHFAAVGDFDWSVTNCPDGRWAAWDDAELAPDRIAYFDTRWEAEDFQREGLASLP
jgi:hypothetical protein